MIESGLLRSGRIAKRRSDPPVGRARLAGVCDPIRACADAIACASAGKHVVVEKPMALRLQDADDTIRACDEAVWSFAYLLTNARDAWS
jgi:UDP-N-acetyl-2-amino-2-deoxyglucuronate dehydrogenase